METKINFISTFHTRLLKYTDINYFLDGCNRFLWNRRSTMQKVVAVWSRVKVKIPEFRNGSGHLRGTDNWLPYFYFFMQSDKTHWLLFFPKNVEMAFRFINDHSWAMKYFKKIPQSECSRRLGTDKWKVSLAPHSLDLLWLVVLLLCTYIVHRHVQYSCLIVWPGNRLNIRSGVTAWY